MNFIHFTSILKKSDKLLKVDPNYTIRLKSKNTFLVQVFLFTITNHLIVNGYILKKYCIKHVQENNSGFECNENNRKNKKCSHSICKIKNRANIKCEQIQKSKFNLTILFHIITFSLIFSIFADFWQFTIGTFK
jgi:hypothetical protein